MNLLPFIAALAVSSLLFGLTVWRRRRAAWREAMHTFEGLRPSAEVFERLGREDPAQLARWLERSSYRPRLAGAIPEDLLPLALEVAREDPELDRRQYTLAPFLDHPLHRVREVALFGMSNPVSREAWGAVCRVLEHDPSPDLRRVAKALLEGACAMPSRRQRTPP